MNRKCAFTICAKNYIGLAQTLEKSLQEKNPDTDFVIFVADEFDKTIPMDLPENVLIAKDECGIEEVDWLDMTFKYDLVEFCTSIKPSCMQTLLLKGYEIVMYFDPDILVFDKLTPVFEALEHHDVIVTPHRIDINNDIANRGGIYNLGFLGVRNTTSTSRMLGWWNDRLKNNASVDPMVGMFTDQKWMDMLPVVMGNDELFVSRHPGLNYAPWNFDERIAVKRDSQFFIQFKNSDNGGEFPLVFLHYSAFKYKEISQGNYNHKGIPMTDREYELFELIRIYGEKISDSEFLNFLKLPYTSGTYSDGTLIQYSHRRIYKRLCEEGHTFSDPFDASGEFFALMSKNRMLSEPTYNPERISDSNVSNIGRKLRIIDLLTSTLIRLIGYTRFSLLARFMIRYLHLSNRSRLLGPKFRKIKVKTF